MATEEMSQWTDHALLIARFGLADVHRILAGDCITIVVTHQLINCEIADQILVLEHGRIAEQGTYDQLAAGGGLFAELLTLSTKR
ncbi:hypothetical protein [Streptomyces sp. NPDC004270]